MNFQRTLSGMIAKYLFYDVPLVWVEGSDDILFFNWLLHHCACRIEVAGGKDICWKLVEALLNNNYPYIVILDGDYSILMPPKIAHKRVVVLQRYSFENYLFEREVIEQISKNYTKSTDEKNIIYEKYDWMIQNINLMLLELIVIDVAHFLAKTGINVLPDKVEILFESDKGLKFSNERISSICEKNKKIVDSVDYDKANTLIKKFITHKRLIDVIPGHFVFGIIRRLIMIGVKSKIGKSPHIDNDGLKLLISAAVWHTLPGEDHQKLKNAIFMAIDNAKRKRRHKATFFERHFRRIWFKKDGFVFWVKKNLLRQ